MEAVVGTGGNVSLVALQFARRTRIRGNEHRRNQSWLAKTVGTATSEMPRDAGYGLPDGGVDYAKASSHETMHA